MTPTGFAIAMWRKFYLGLTLVAAAFLLETFLPLQLF